jgi:NADH-quinone oxidoreductase subunit C
MSLQDTISKFRSSHPSSRFDESVSHEQTSAVVNIDGLLETLSFFKREGFEVLMDLTGVDYLTPSERTKVIYWLHNPTNFERIRICVFVGRNESIPSVISLWEGADWFERELYDLFGVRFTGRAEPTRILMPDNWTGHPLRKSYPLTEVPVEFKHGVMPKVPSQIIPSGRFSTCQE